MTISIIKVGGNELDQPEFLAQLVVALAAMRGETILVHGGGKEISAALNVYDQPVRFVEGLRVTPPESMAIMEMVVCGSVNKRLVARLVGAGVAAIGLSGVDLGLLRCLPISPELGRVGRVSAVNRAALSHMLAQGWLPVIAPVALGAEDGLSYNVNADMIAEAIAAEFGVQGQAELLFVSNVPGVLIDGAVLPNLSPEEVDAAIASGTITGGMIPKVRAALAALERGVASVRITNLAGLAAGGTCFRR